MKRSSFDSAVARHGLSAVRQMSAAGMPVLPENPVRRSVSREANVSAPGEGISSRPLSGAARASVACSDRPEGSKQLQVHREPINAAEPDGCDPVTIADDGRLQASGGAAPVITYPPSALTGAETAPAYPATPPATAGAVNLSDATLFILRLIAAHEGRSERDIVAQLIAAAGEAIGLSPLLTHAAGEIGDLSSLPNYARRAANRFRGGVP
nr:hypothetical protein 7 [Spirochaetaceae bacterium]BDD44750.1 hypothetical protein 8 [bacterium]BDD45563.1 hypothetical protein 12 [bacterium]